MNFTRIISARSVGALALVCTVAAICSATAAADPAARSSNYYAHVRPDDRPGIRGVGPQHAVSQPAAARPDDRAGIHGVGSPEALPSAATHQTSGFDWADAGVGAASAFALVALGGAGFLLLRRRRDLEKGRPVEPVLHG